MRIHNTVVDFSNGMVLKTDKVGDIGVIRLRGYKLGEKVSTLTTSGGWEDWDTPTNFNEINGIYRWYDEEGGADLLVFGNDTVTYGLKRYNIESKTITSIQADTDFDRQAPVMFINCDSQVIVLPDGKKDSPYSLKLFKTGSIRTAAAKLGLQPSADEIQVLATPDATITDWIEGDGEYSWAISYLYGTKDEPGKYGESGLSKIVTLDLPATSGSFSASINVVSAISGFVQKIYIYRTQKDGVTFYRVGEIKDTGVITFVDNVKDINVDLSLPAPTQFGLPGAIKCGRWYNNRFYYFGFDGVLRWTAAGFPDIHPANFFLKVENIGFEGTWVGVIRDNIYVGKEDGIFLIYGDSPNYRYKKVSDIQCYSRCSMVEMPDAIYFLGKDGKRSKVFRFDGYNPIPISLPISDLISHTNKDVHKRAFGIRVGLEYWLSILTYDSRASRWPNPFNNVILSYNTVYNSWGINFGQISAMTVMNGSQDNGEIYGCESDPASDSSKGTFYRWEDNLGTASFTNHIVGSPVRSKTAQYLRDISLGISPGFKDRNKLEKVSVHAIKIRSRGALNLNPTLLIYDDSFTIQDTLQSTINPETSSVLGEIVLTGDMAPIYGQGEYNSGVQYLDTYVEERLFNLADTLLRTGYILNISYAFSNSRHIEVEGLEVMYSTTDTD